LKLLVTGSAGQLGRSLVAALRGREAVFLSHAELDIADESAVRAAVLAQRPDVVVNAAAYNFVDKAETDEAAAFRANAEGPRQLALASHAIGAAIVHVSTDYVFDGEATRPYHELDATGPLSAYGRSKLAGEEAVRESNPKHYVVRTAWVFAPEGRNFPNTMRSLAEKGPVRVVTDQVGSPTYAPHLAEGIVRLVDSGAFGLHHLAGRGETSWHRFTVELFDRLGLGAAVLPATTAEFPRPARRPRYAPLVSVREPRLVLPAWQDGVAAFAQAVRA
jgi:dTDP-4-dehydrorhamnose reductase